MIKYVAALTLWAGAAQAACVAGDGAWIERVCYSDEETSPVYGHNILGDTPEWSELVVFYGPEGQAASDGDRGASSVFPDGYPNGALLFEDVAPRLIDVTGDGRLEAIVVESSAELGARVSVYAFEPAPRLLAATPYIGQRNRWFSPVGAADLDGDGRVEIAFVDRPHLARVLRVFRFVDGGLDEVAQAAGVTNHRIGETDIAGGIRECGDGPEMIVATADWSRLLAVRFDGAALVADDIGPHVDRGSFAAAMGCR